MSKDLNQLAAEALERDRRTYEAERQTDAVVLAGSGKGRGLGNAMAVTQRIVWIQNSRAIEAAVKEYKEGNYFPLMELGMAEDPSPYQQGYHDLMRNLDELSGKLITYTGAKRRATENISSRYLERGRLLNQCIKDLDSCITQMTKLMQYPESDDKKFNFLYTKLNSLYADMSQTRKGSLIVPETPTQKAEYGDRSIIHVNNIGLKEPRIRPDDRFMRELERHNGSYKYLDVPEEPLFRNVPSMEDIRQGNIGNCYMIATLQAMCAQSPQTILDAMVDHGTKVTVRFFDTNQNPVFVTVTKSIPVYEINGQLSHLYGEGPLWVQMMEKAYAASGLANNRVGACMNGFYGGDYQDIDSGDPRSFAAALLGTDDSKNIGGSERFFTPDSYNQQGAYTEKEQKFFDKIAAAVEAGNSVIAGSRRNFAEIKDLDNELDPQGKTFGGIVPRHAYTVTGAYPENGKYYVILRNPHANHGRNIDVNGKPVDDPSANGFSKMELRSFCKFFMDVCTTEFTLTAALRDRIPEGRDLVRRFGGAVNFINRAIESTAGRVWDKAWSTTEFNKLRAASVQAAAAMNAANPDPEAIKKSMEELFLKAEIYENAKKGMKDFQKDFGKEFRLRQRVKAAEMISLLKADYRAGDPQKEVSFIEYARKAGDAVEQIDREFGIAPDLKNASIRSEKAAGHALAAADQAMSADRQTLKGLLEAFERGDDLADYQGAFSRTLAISMVHKAQTLKLQQGILNITEAKAAAFEKQLTDDTEARKLEKSDAFKSYVEKLTYNDWMQLANDEEGIYIQRDFNVLAKEIKKAELQAEAARLENPHPQNPEEKRKIEEPVAAK